MLPHPKSTHKISRIKHPSKPRRFVLKSCVYLLAPVFHGKVLPTVRFVRRAGAAASISVLLTLFSSAFCFSWNWFATKADPVSFLLATLPAFAAAIVLFPTLLFVRDLPIRRLSLGECGLLSLLFTASGFALYVIDVGTIPVIALLGFHPRGDVLWRHLPFLASISAVNALLLKLSNGRS